MSNPCGPKLAAVVTTYFKYSHAQHIVDRFLDGYGWNGTHHYPPMDLVSLYVDQVGANDLSRERAPRHPGMKIYPTIAEALTPAGKLAVDGVVMVGEHGNYPRNEKGQTKYPRCEFFEQIVKVFRDSGRVRAALQRQAPLLELGVGARDVRYVPRDGVPVHGRLQPARDLAHALGRDAARARESAKRCASATAAWTATIFTASKPSNAWWSAGAAARPASQWIQAYRGEKFWDALREGVWPQALMDAALCRSHTLTPARAGFNESSPQSTICGVW